MTEAEKRLLEIISGKEEIRKGDRMVSFLYDEVFESMRWRQELPYLQFPADCQIKIIPAFLSAIIRFIVRKKTTPRGEFVSVYFDGYSNLGHFSFPEPTPHWEIFPDQDGDNARFALGDEESMLQAIEASLQKLEKE